MKIEQRLVDLGIELTVPMAGPKQYGKRYGKMKPFVITGTTMHLCGHSPGMKDGVVRFPGRLGHDVTIEEGYQAARLTGINCISTIKRAIGDLDRVTAVVSTLNYVACTHDFFEHYKITNGLTDLLEEVFGPDIGLGARATYGAPSLTDNYCFETSMILEIDGPAT
ncbi:RidA family protein [uncultured Roseibium sp.]|uniref:RidA family protein n=1 Tax=uncultured Roseibium sp. TaxID=1936171 RepID=UPI003216876D